MCLDTGTVFKRYVLCPHCKEDYLFTLRAIAHNPELRCHGCGGSIRLSDRDEALLSDVRNTLDEIDTAPPSFISEHRRLAFNNHFDDLIGKLDVLRVTCDNERHGLLSAPSIDTRAHGVEINKIARKLGIGVSVVSRVVSGGAK